MPCTLPGWMLTRGVDMRLALFGDAPPGPGVLATSRVVAAACGSGRKGDRRRGSVGEVELLLDLLDGARAVGGERLAARHRQVLLLDVLEDGLQIDRPGARRPIDQ